MKKEKNENQKKSAFSLVSKILLILLCIAIVVEICIIISIKVRHDNLEKENGKITTTSSFIANIEEKLTLSNEKITIYQ